MTTQSQRERMKRIKARARVAVALASSCLNAKAHTPCPERYLDWYRWAVTMSKTHKQTACPDCQMMDIWEVK